MAGGLEEKIKVYVPDTNVLINNPFLPFYLSGNTIPKELQEDEHTVFGVFLKEEQKQGDPNIVVISEIVEKELDGIKGNPNKSEYTRISANRALKVLSFIRELGDQQGTSFLNGVKLANGAIIYKQPHNMVEFEHQQVFNATNDDRIVYDVAKLQISNPKAQVVFVSNDRFARSKAFDRGLKAEPSTHDQIKTRELYAGYDIVSLDARGMESVRSRQNIPLNDPSLKGITRPNATLHNNHFVIFRNTQNPDDELQMRVQDGKLTHSVYYNKFMKELNQQPLLEDVISPQPGEFTKKNLARRIQESSFDDKKKRKIYGKIESIIGNPLDEINHKRVLEILQEVDTKAIEAFKTAAQKHEYAQEEKKNKRISLPFNNAIQPIGLQKAYVDLLLNPNIGCVSVIGEQGSGKTYFAMLCGLYLVNQGHFDAVRYFTPLVSIGADIGYLPGGMQQKLQPWMKAFDDNVREIFGYFDLPPDVHRKATMLEEIYRLKDNVYFFDVATYIKGRTIRKELVILDEAHLYTRDQTKVLIGRSGKGSKYIIIGDPRQINAADRKHYITPETSGIVHINAKLPGKSNLFAHITLPDNFSQRSPVADLANLL